jgi:hypothetical protein
MAKKQVVSYSYTCDVCGDTIPDTPGDDATHKVSWEGADYVVDVCTDHGSQLGNILGQLKGFVDAGHRAGARRGRRPAAATTAVATRPPRLGRTVAATSGSGTGPKRGGLGAVRAWAGENGYQVSERGRIPSAILAAYDAANSAASEAAADAPKASPTPRQRRPRKAAARASS